MRSIDHKAISEALFGKTQRALLGFLFGHPDEKFYLRELARAIGAGLGAVQREVKRLSEAGILERTTRGREVFYQANPQSPIFQDLKSLVLKTMGAADLLRKEFEKLKDKVRVAFIYGSFAKGEPRKESDVDLLVVGNVTLAEIVAKLEKSQKALGREINPTVYPVSEFRKKLSAGNHFLQSVLKEPKIFLVGGEDELKRLAQERLA
ncbi:MAG: nucleotidyltransferase domain-containing protein [Pseudomonadota bacterium]